MKPITNWLWGRVHNVINILFFYWVQIIIHNCVQNITSVMQWVWTQSTGSQCYLQSHLTEQQRQGSYPFQNKFPELFQDSYWVFKHSKTYLFAFCYQFASVLYCIWFVAYITTSNLNLVTHGRVAGCRQEFHTSRKVIKSILPTYRWKLCL